MPQLTQTQLAEAFIRKDETRAMIDKTKASIIRSYRRVEQLQNKVGDLEYWLDQVTEVVNGVPLRVTDEPDTYEVHRLLSYPSIMAIAYKSVRPSEGWHLHFIDYKWVAGNGHQFFCGNWDRETAITHARAFAIDGRLPA